MGTSTHNIADTIEDFVRREFRVQAGDPYFSRDAHLYENGLVDSAGVIELIEFIESTFNVKLPEEYLFSEEFTTINGISRIVESCYQTQ